MRVLIPYHSFSGNTEEVAELIEGKLQEKYGCTVSKYDIGYETYFPEVSEYDLMLLGTFTWDQGSTPDDIKDFVADVGYKPENVAVFGTGETQFGGDEMFCAAVTKLAKFYNSKWEGLRIEQSPRGSQEVKVIDWINNIMNDFKERQKEDVVMV